MIVRELGDGRLLCINQTSHAAMAEAFCRHWGNADFTRPAPYDVVMLAIGQHDNGWFEWEQTPRLRSDGYPMDFVHHDDPLEKVALWQRGVERLRAQHPYAGLLVAKHAALLYEAFPGRNLDRPAQDAIRKFIADEAALEKSLAGAWHAVPEMAEWLEPGRIAANTRLLQFGDSASLRVTMPWSRCGEITHCPVDFAGTETTLVMCYDDSTIQFEPWPFGVEYFDVSTFGRLLAQTRFASPAEYHAALAAAPYLQLSWRVERNT